MFSHLIPLIRIWVYVEWFCGRLYHVFRKPSWNFKLACFLFSSFMNSPFWKTRDPFHYHLIEDYNSRHLSFRHTWGGVATPGESPSHPRVWRPGSSSVERTDAAAEKNGVFGKGMQEAVSYPRPTVQTTVNREAKDRWQSVQAAVAGGSAVSRWFSNASVVAASESREGARSPVPLLSSMLARSTVNGVVAPSVRGTVHGTDREMVHGTNEEHVNGIDRGKVHGSELEPVNGNINGSVRRTVHGTLCSTERPTRVNDDGSLMHPAPPVASVTPSSMASSFVVLGAGGRSGEGDGARSSGHAFRGGFSRYGDGEVVSPGEREEEETEEGEELDGSWEVSNDCFFIRPLYLK